MASSRFCQLLWFARASFNIAEPVSGKRPRLFPEEFRALIKTIHESIRRRGANMLLVEWPGRFNINPITPRHLRTPWQREVHRYGGSSLVLELGGPPRE
ncbi:MAG: hypothetical protein O7A63_07865 [Acidobacteria bacterium]|nr:hypothetical protein [Acidobacteriota bacterium]